MFGSEALLVRKTLAYPAVIGALALSVAIPKAANGGPERSPKMPAHLVFEADPNGNYQIFLENLITNKLVNLSRNQYNDMNPEVSPNGKEIVFYSDRDGNSQIFEVEIAHPGHAKRLTHDQANDYDPSYMPDGRIIYKKSTNGLGDIMIMNANGSHTRNLTPRTPNSEQWKPAPINNHEIVFASAVGSARANPNTNELDSLNLKTHKEKRLTKNDVPDWYPAYNPVSKKIAFISNPEPEPGVPDEVYSMAPNGKYRTKLTNLPGDSDDPSWSRNGKYIVFSNDASGHYHLDVMNSNGSNTRQLNINLAGDQKAPAFLPQN